MSNVGHCAAGYDIAESISLPYMMLRISTFQLTITPHDVHNSFDKVCLCHVVQ